MKQRHFHDVVSYFERDFCFSSSWNCKSVTASDAQGAGLEENRHPGYGNGRSSHSRVSTGTSAM
jgi:hypothetical protein